MDSSSIAPYGRSFEEYCLMFDLGSCDRHKRILGVGDGPSNFNAVATQRGWRVTSVDPLYKFEVTAIESRCEAVLDQMIAAVSLVPQHWTWSFFRSPGDLRAYRQHVAKEFTIDRSAIKTNSRYVCGELPRLPFRADSFDVALCSHVLFSWSGMLDAQFHIEAIAEMLRVARQVRIVPTSRNMSQVRSRYVAWITQHFQKLGCSVELEAMNVKFKNASTERMVLRRS